MPFTLNLAVRTLRAMQPLYLPLFLLAAAVTGVVYLEPLAAHLDLTENWRATFERAMEIALWLTAALVISRAIRVFVWDGIFVHTMGRMPPRLIVQLGGIVIFLLAVSGIIGVVFEQSVVGIWATSSAVGVVIGLAVQNLILDTASGIALNIERPFKPGDWINVHTRFGEYIGRVIETNWRTTRLWTTGRNVITIPNSFMTTTIVTNYSMPGSISRFELDFTLDFSVDTQRGLRILNAALLGAVGERGPLGDPEPKVRISGVGEHGIVYKARYYIDPIVTSPSKARHSVIASVMEHVGRAGLTLAYPKSDVFVARMPWRQQNWTSPKDQARQLGKLSLFGARTRRSGIPGIAHAGRFVQKRRHSGRTGRRGGFNVYPRRGPARSLGTKRGRHQGQGRRPRAGHVLRRKVAFDRRAALCRGRLRDRFNRLRDHQGRDHRTVRARSRDP